MEKRIPQFKSLEEEIEFWDKHSVTEFEAEEVTVEEILEEFECHSNKTKVILSLEREMQNQLKALADKRGVSYSSLIHELLLQGLKTASAEFRLTSQEVK